jgi:hypothetical protein
MLIRPCPFDRTFEAEQSLRAGIKVGLVDFFSKKTLSQVRLTKAADRPIEAI